MALEFVKETHQFLKKPIYRVENAEALKLEIRQIYNEKNNESSFPGAQPISLEKKNLETILNNEYVAGAKLDGERFLLYTTYFDNKNLTMLIDRTFTFYLVQQKWAHKNAFEKHILIDGELTEEGNYYVHDVCVVEGQNVMERDFKTRLQLFEVFLRDKRWKTSEKNSFNIYLKRFYSISELNLLVETKQFQNSSDGIVFYPVNEPVQKRTQFSLFKWKPKHTIDFKIKNNKEEQITDLLTWDPKERKEYVYETVELLDEYPDGSIVEFDVYLDNEDIVFEPIKERTDKSTGNSQFTIDRTLFNVEENITLDFLLKTFLK